MWVVNNTKERVKQYLRSDIESSITNLTAESNRVHDSIAAISRVAAGTATGIDQQMLGSCQRALQEIATSIQNLYMCRNLVDALDTREWVDDE